MKKQTALEQLEYWIEQYYRINGTPTLNDIKGQINLLKDYEREQLRSLAEFIDKDLIDNVPPTEIVDRFLSQ